MAARKVLTFITAEVARVIADVLAAKAFRPNYADLYNPEFHKGGVVKKGADGFPDGDNIDPAKLKPALWLVKDNGIYLMGNAVFMKGQETAVLAYAVEANPEKLSFEEWWENAGRIMGGDDSCESLRVEWFEKAIASGKPTFRLRITQKSIGIEF